MAGKWSELITKFASDLVGLTREIFETWEINTGAGGYDSSKLLCVFDLRTGTRRTSWSWSGMSSPQLMYHLIVRFLGLVGACSGPDVGGWCCTV